MSISGIAASPQTQQIAESGGPPSAHHRRGAAQAPSISDVDAQSASPASSKSSTGRAGGKVDITV